MQTASVTPLVTLSSRQNRNIDLFNDFHAILLLKEANNKALLHIYTKLEKKSESKEYSKPIEPCMGFHLRFLFSDERKMKCPLITELHICPAYLK